jgi:hypothetical protein
MAIIHITGRLTKENSEGLIALEDWIILLNKWNKVLGSLPYVTVLRWS